MGLRALESNAPLEELIVLINQKEQLEAREKVLREQILEAVLAEPEQKGEHAGFTFSIQSRRKFAYSAKLQQMEETLKALKKLEEKDGTAFELPTTTSLVVTKPKNK